MRRAVYAGSFDPPTNGHLWMIKQGVKLFDKLIVAVGANPDKRTVFTVGERVLMLKEATVTLNNVVIDAFPYWFLVDYTVSVNAQYILRGIRSLMDYEYERAMRSKNLQMNSGIETVFLMTPPGIGEVSSSMVRGCIGPRGWERIVKNDVPPPVYVKLLEKFGGKDA